MLWHQPDVSPRPFIRDSLPRAATPALCMSMLNSAAETFLQQTLPLGIILLQFSTHHFKTVTGAGVEALWSPSTLQTGDLPHWLSHSSAASYHLFCSPCRPHEAAGMLSGVPPAGRDCLGQRTATQQDRSFPGQAELGSALLLLQQPSFPLFKRANYFWLSLKWEGWRLQKENRLPTLLNRSALREGTLQCFELLICPLSQQRSGHSSVRSRLLFNAWVSFTQRTERVF